MDMQAVVDGKVDELWHKVVYSCNKIMNQAEIYGIQLMDIPEPNIHQIAKLFDSIVIPLLDELARDFEFSPESGIRIANIKKLTMHLRAITIAIDEENVEKFDEALALLNQEPMII